MPNTWFPSDGVYRRLLNAALAALLVFTTLAILPGAIAPADAISHTTPNTNPDLPQVCGLDVLLVLDESGSIETANAVGQVKDAYTALVDALKNTGSRLAVAEFNSTARLPIGTLTAVTDATAAGIFATYIDTQYDPPGNPQYWTNWEDAFRVANLFAPSADLVMFVTDGNPTAIIDQNVVTSALYDTKIPLIVTGQSDTTDDVEILGDNATAYAAGTVAAIPNANGVKAGGAHVLAIGVGNAFSTTGATDRLKDISGPSVFETGTFNIHTDDVYKVADFSGLANAMRVAVFSACESTITITKHTDGDGDGVFDDGDRSGFEFNASLTASTGTVTPLNASDVTDGLGIAQIDWDLSDKSATADLVVTESTKSGWVFRSDKSTCDVASLVNPNYNVSDHFTETADGFTITGLPSDAIVTCNAFNEAMPTLTLVKTVINDGGGTLSESDFDAFIDQTQVAWGTANALTASTYTASESTQPGYTASVWGGHCDEKGSVTLAVGDNFTCTITNTFVPREPDPTTLTLVKTVINDGGGILSESDFDAFIDQTQVTWGTANVVAAGPHTASESTQPGYTASVWGGHCDEKGNVTLAVGDNFTCTITNTFVPNPGIDIEKATNGSDADAPTGPSILVGGLVTWTYVVTNDGNVPLSTIVVTDDKEGVISGPDSGDTHGDGILDTDETWTYTATGTAAEGQYANLGTATGDYDQGETTVKDTDRSHYIGVTTPPPPVSGIDIEKATNGFDSDTAPGESIDVGDPVTWTYVVTNTGEIHLTGVIVTDDILGAICTIGDLAIGASSTCTFTGTAVAGLYVNVGTATGNGGGLTVTDSDKSHYNTPAVGASATIGDTVWSDENENGVQDNGEKGIAGATVRLTLPDATTVQTSTNASGLYLFSALEAGEYNVELIVSSIPEPSDGSNTLTTPGSFTILLADGQSFLDADFGIAAGLPATGIASDQIVLIALALLLLGGLALLAVNRRKGNRGEGDMAA